MKRQVISAEAAKPESVIAGYIGGEFTISAIGAPPKAPLDVAPNSRAAVGAGVDGGANIKLDTPDANGGKMDPGPMGNKIDGKDGNAPLPRFNLSAYNGGPMRLSGWKFPVIIDATGAKSATPQLPIYVGHIAENAPASEMMETLIGQAALQAITGCLRAQGDITGTSKTVNLMRDHAAKGFKFQCSVHGSPTLVEFVPEGKTALVNNRLCAGPCVVARESVLDHIAILPLGADTSTSANIAAQHAAGEETMEFGAWLKAEYGMEQADFDKQPELAKTKIKAAFDIASKRDTKVETKEEIKATGAVDAEAVIKAQNEAFAANMNRVAKIQDMAKDFPKIAAQAVSEGWTEEKTEVAVLKAQRDQLTSATFGAGRHVGVGSIPVENAPRVLEAAALMSCGYSAEKLAKDRHYGEKVANMTDDMFRRERTRVFTPASIARIIARHHGVALPDGHGDDFWSDALANEAICPRGNNRISAEFSTMSLPVALSNIMNKFVMDGYLSVDPNDCDPEGGVAWKQFTRISSVQDFKPHYRIRMVASLLLQALRKGGEIEHGSIGEQSYMLTADTKAIMLGLTRKDLINDDQSVLSTLPTHFGVGAAETVATDIYTCLIAALQSDASTAFFTASAVTTEGNKMVANLLTGAGLGYTTLEAARAQFAIQTKPNGQPAGILGKVLLVPPQKAGLAKQLCENDTLIASLSTGGNARGTPSGNNLKGLQRPVSSAYLYNLTGGSATTWFLMAQAMATAYAIEVGFLNGTEVPVIERAEADFNRLGIGFRTFLDYGVALGEPRAVVKNTA